MSEETQDLKTQDARLAEQPAEPGHAIQGKLHGPGTLFLHHHIGAGKVDDIEVEFSFNMGNGAPLVYCPSTGKWFSVSWDEIIRGAFAAGVTRPFTKQELKESKVRKEAAR